MSNVSSLGCPSGLSRLLLWVCVGLVSLCFFGCSDDREVVFATDAAPMADDRQAVLADIAALSNGKDLLNAELAKRYHDSVDALIGRGSRIEGTLIEALGGNDNWAVRLGAVEVLKAVATRRSIEPLMGALEDPQPLVALHAEHLLRAMTKHTVIPAAGEPPLNEVPPLPVRSGEETDEDVWAAWHKKNGTSLHQAWLTWWKTNQNQVVIE